MYEKVRCVVKQHVALRRFLFLYPLHHLHGRRVFSLDIVRDRSRVAAEHSTHLHLIPNGRAYHGILGRISFCSIRDHCSLEKREKERYPVFGIYILHTISGLDACARCVLQQLYFLYLSYSYAHQASHHEGSVVGP